MRCCVPLVQVVIDNEFVDCKRPSEDQIRDGDSDGHDRNTKELICVHTGLQLGSLLGDANHANDQR